MAAAAGRTLASVLTVHRPCVHARARRTAFPSTSHEDEPLLRRRRSELPPLRHLGR